MGAIIFDRHLDSLFDGSLRAHPQLEDKDWGLDKQRDLINTDPLKMIALNAYHK